MDLVFPAQRIVETTLTANANSNQPLKSLSSRGYFVLDPTDEELLFSKIKPEITIFFLWNMTENRDVWSVVFFSEPIKGSSKVLEARANLRDQLVFAAYGNVTPGMIDPPLGAFAIQSKSSLEAGATRHPIFARAWKLLKDKTENANWVTLIDITSKQS